MLSSSAATAGRRRLCVNIRAAPSGPPYMRKIWGEGWCIEWWLGGSGGVEMITINKGPAGVIADFIRQQEMEPW